MIDTLRSCAETLFFCLERAVTAALYPWCLLRRRLGARPRVPILMYHQVGRPVEGVPACTACVSQRVWVSRRASTARSVRTRTSATRPT